ncbi:hypothetical protein GCM10011390_45610 [Aureimonas endophytica]|uniref:Uncharacterized protein n=1 Tax=Aureimonas endophytica TaxID=2027858 RepID=A0A917A0G1_9HYPH|nr:hypothetical protein [Aureimonas endophytica]GGE21194.1 hypothetical protein GCM10011390_45610 [Aureimonas endophytica]
MQNSIWTYSWDIQDVGMAEFLADIRERAGADMVSLAVSYHAGRFLQPRSPKRKVYFPEDGTVYYRPDPALWDKASIAPLVARNVEEGGDMLAALVAERERGGPAVSAWTVCLHNTRLGLLHPGEVTRTAFDDANSYSLCPSSPAARRYVTGLVRDITTRYRPDRLELESPSFMGFAHGYHHEKDGVGLLPEDDFLLSLCFCRHCTAQAGAAGIDMAEARRMVRGFVAAACERAVPEPQLPDFPARGIDAFAPWPALHEFLAWRRTPVMSLLAEIRAAADPATRLVLVEGRDAWLGGVDLAEAGRLLDGLVLCAYDMAPEAVARLAREGRRLVGPDRFLGLGYRLFHPEMRDEADFVAKVAAGRAEGVDGLNVYNYGLVPRPRLDWVRAALA